MEFYNSGNITHRSRKKGIIWTGQNAEHVMQEHLTLPKLHPFTHVRIQQLAKSVAHWEKKKGARHVGIITDLTTGQSITIVADVYGNFALLITAIKS